LQALLVVVTHIAYSGQVVYSGIGGQMIVRGR
jgi:hypothetical protein